LTCLLPDPRSFYSWKSPLTVVPKLRLHQIPELRIFLILWTLPVSNHLEMDSRFAHRILIRPLFSRIIRRSGKCMRFIRVSLWMFPSLETELSIPKLTHEFIRELCKSDISRVKSFCPIPNNKPAIYSHLELELLTLLLWLGPFAPFAFVRMEARFPEP
jgi:hypothetical protein